MDAGQVVTLILGGGGAIAISTLIKSWLAVRNSADTRESTAIGNLERWTDDANARADRAAERERAAHEETAFQRELVAYWQSRAGELEASCRSHGGSPPPPSPRPTRKVHS